MVFGLLPDGPKRDPPPHQSSIREPIAAGVRPKIDSLLISSYNVLSPNAFYYLRLQFFPRIITLAGPNAQDPNKRNDIKNNRGADVEKSQAA